MSTLTVDFPRSVVASTDRVRAAFGVEQNKLTIPAAPVAKPGLLARFRAWLEEREQHAEELRTLARMTDRQLADIGMTRGDVWRMAR